MRYLKIITLLILLYISLLSTQSTQPKVTSIPPPNPPTGYITKSYNYQLEQYEYVPINTKTSYTNSYTKKGIRKGWCMGDRYHKPHRLPRYSKSKWVKVK